MSSHEEKLLSKNGFLKSAIWGMNYLMVLEEIFRGWMLFCEMPFARGVMNH